MEATMRVVMLGALLVACDPSTASLDDPPAAASEVEIPVVALREVAPGLWLDVARDRTDVDLMAEGFVNLALGQDYASDIALELGAVWQGRCEWEGTWTPASVTSSDPTLLAASVQDGVVQLDVRASGHLQLEVLGTYDARCSWDTDPYQAHALSIVYEIEVLEPAGFEIVRPLACVEEGPLVLVTGTPMVEGFRVLPLNADGEPRDVDNAREDRQVRLKVQTSEGVSVVAPAAGRGLDGLSVLGSEGVVTLSGPAGTTQEIEVVPPASVGGLELFFVVPWGAFHGDLVVEDGGTYAWNETYSLDNRHLVMVSAGRPQVDGELACSQPNPGWLDFVAAPAQGELGELDFQDQNFPMTLPLGAEIVRDGTVTLTVSAPQLGDGTAAQQTVSATFVP